MTKQEKKKIDGLMKRWDELANESLDLLFKINPALALMEMDVLKDTRKEYLENMKKELPRLEKEYDRVQKKLYFVIKELRKTLENAYNMGRHSIYENRASSIDILDAF